MGDARVRPSRFGRRRRDVLGWSALSVAAAALAARYLPVYNHVVLILAAMSPYLMLGSAVASVLFLLNRRLLPTALALSLLVAAVLPQVWGFFEGKRAPDHAIPIRVLTANLRDGTADPASVASAAREGADLLLVQELSPALARTLSDNYLKPDFPYEILDPGSYAHGVGIWSRYPIVQSSHITKFTLGGLTATVRPPEAASDLIVASVHLVGPWPQPVDKWRDEIAALPETLQHLEAAAGRGAAIVGGDLNATADHLPFRRLLDTGFRDAARQFGFPATWPADLPLPPVIRIDHILTYNSTARDPYAVRIAGSDHLALGATVYIPG
jgi:endonuclease/exonuclease/phosphatase (EEP) superfamily protein YafD